MALSQFGGRGGSGSGSSGKEIGEVFLVPQTYSSPDVVDAGETIISGDYPLLFPKITNGSITNNFVTRQWALSDGAITTARPIKTVVHQNAAWVLCADGSVVSSTNGTSWTSRGALGNPADASYPNLWNNNADESLLPTGLMFSMGTRLVVVNTSSKYCAGFYTDDLGVTWNTYSTDTVANTAVAGSATAYNIVGGNGFAVLVDMTTKKIYRSTTGIGGWTDVTGSITLPTATTAPVMFSDATSTIFYIGGSHFRSLDNGLTWLAVTHAMTGTVPSNYVRFGGSLYTSSWVSPTRTYYKSTDNGTTWAASGTHAAASNTGIFYVGSDGHIGGLLGTSTDGATWTANTYGNAAHPVSPLSTAGTQILIPNGSGFTWMMTNRYSGTARTTNDYGTTLNVVNPISSTGFGSGVFAVDSATSTNGTTVILTNTISTSNNSGSNGRQAVHNATLYNCNIAYVGNWTAGFVPVTLPVSDVWYGISYNAAANLFIVSGTVSDAALTSSDGITWNTVTAPTLAQSPKTTTPRTINNVTYMVPSTATAQPLQMFVARPDGTGFWMITPYTRTNWPIQKSEYLTEFSHAIVASATSSGVGMYWLDPRLVSGVTSDNKGVQTLANALALPAVATYAVAHKNAMVIRPNGNAATQLTTTLIADTVTSANVATNQLGETTPTNVRPMALLSYGGSLFVFCSGNTNAYGLGSMVKSSSDMGATWTAFSTLTSIPTSDTIYYGKTFGDGTVVLFGSLGTYIYDVASSSNTTSKTLNSGWVAPSGLKYVVKAK